MYVAAVLLWCFGCVTHLYCIKNSNRNFKISQFQNFKM